MRRGLALAIVICAVLSATGSAVAQVGAPAENRWTPIGPEGATVLSLARDPSDDRHLVAGTYFGGLYESHDGGFNWTPLSSQFSHVPIFALAFDPSQVGTIYAGTFESGAYKTVNSGSTWVSVNEGLTGKNLSALAVDPFNPARVIATTTDRGAFLSDSRGTSWRPIADEYPILAKTVAFDPVARDVVYLGTLGHGILRSVDGGTTWGTFNEGLTAASVLALTFDAITHDKLFAATDDGVYEHISGKPGWTAMSKGLPEFEVTAILSHPAVPSLLFAVTPAGLYFTFGPAETYGSWAFAASVSGRLMTIDRAGLITHLATTHGGLLATTDFGATWISASRGMQNVFVGALSAAADGATTKLYAGTDGVRFTTDGASWQTGNLRLGVFEIKPHPRDSNTLFAGLERDGVWKTSDAGRTWNPAASGILPTQVYAIGQSSAWPHPLYAGTSSGLFMSWNGGDEWSALPTGNIPIVLSIAPDPIRPVTFFGYAGGQVYKTIDEGRTVLPVSTGLPTENITALKVVAWDKVYAVSSGGELYATADDGLNWLPWRNGVVEPALSIDVDPDLPWIVYLGTAGGGVYKSESGGIDWTARNEGLNGSFITALAVDPGHSNTIFAGSIGAVYKSVDGAAHWTDTGPGLPAGVVTSLVIDATNTQIVYASIQDHGIFKTVNGGTTWSAINVGLPSSGPAPLVIDRFDHTRLFAGTQLKGVHRSSDGGATWAPQTKGISLFVRALAIDPVTPNTMYAGSLGGGIFRTNDGAASWEYVGLRDQNIFKLAVDPQQPSYVYAATAQGLSRSIDGGATWNSAGQKAAYVNSMAVDSADRQTIYAGTDNGQVWRSADGGVNWAPRPGLPGDNVRALEVDGARRVVYASAGAKGFFRSLDAGSTWWRLPDARIDAQLVNALAIDSITGTLYAATNEGGVLRSTTWGESWVTVNTGLTSLRMSHILVAPQQSGVLYASTFDRGVFKSIDGGQRWYWIGYGLTTGVIFSVTPDRRDSLLLYAATEAGLFRSTNGGSSWTPRGLEGLTVAAVQVDTDNSLLLYAAVKGAGFFRSADGGITWSASNSNLSTLDIRFVGVGRGGQVYAGTLGGGVARSTDAGASWHGGTTPWAAAPAMLTVVVDPVNAGTLYAGTGGVGVLKSTNYGADWTPVNNGIESQFVLSMAVDPVTPSTVYAGTVNGGVYVSASGGRNWRPLNDGLFNRVVTSLAVDPLDHRVVYAGTEGGGVFAAKVVPTNANCAYSMTPESLSVPPAGGPQVIQIATSEGCNWTANSFTEWVIVSSSTAGQGSATVDVWIGPNSGADVRSGVLLVAGKQIVISQIAVSQSHLLSIAKTGLGHGTIASEPQGIFCADDCSEWFQHGTAVQLAAYSDAESVFVGWSGSPGCADTSFTLNGPVACTARFEVRNDLDGDALPDDWERNMGLDPASAEGDNGPHGDPDGDGISNGDEYLAGSHPRGVVRRFFAEGAADQQFSTEFALLNSTSSTAHVLLTFLTPDGSRATHVVVVPARAHSHLDAAEVSGLPAGEFAAIVESDSEIVAERTLLWDRTHFGSSSETAVQSPSITWYFADAPSGPGRQHRYLVLNPSANSALVTFTFHRPLPALPVVRSYTIGGLRRATILISEDDPQLANANAWTAVAADVPVVVERSAYLSTSTGSLAAGYAVAGVPAAALTWTLPDGPTGTAFESFAFVANPNDVASNVSARFLLASGLVLTKSFEVAPHQRAVLNLEQQDAALGDAEFSTRIESTNGVSIVVEGATFWPGQFLSSWYGASASAGVPEGGTKWGIAGAEVGGPDFAQASLTIVNVAAISGQVQVTVMFEDGTNTARTFAVGPLGRLAIDLGTEFPETGWRRFGALVESLGGAPIPIVVEHSSYLNTNGRPWDSGGRATATRLAR